MRHIQKPSFISRVVLLIAIWVLGFTGSAVGAWEYQCMVVKSSIVGPTSITLQPGESIDSRSIPVRQITIQGMNFGDNPVVYFGEQRQPITVVGVGQSDSMDTVTVDLPPGTPMGSYKIAIENTTGPFLDNDRDINPIFCFGSVETWMQMQ